MKILLFTKNWIGDVVFQLPAIEVIRKAWPNAEIVCAAPARCREILESCPAVNRVLTFDEKKEHRPWLKRLGFALKIRTEKFDKVYFFHRSRTRAFLAMTAGISDRIGYASGRKGFLTKAIQEPGQKLHHADYYLHLLRETGLQAPEKAEYHLAVSSDILKKAQTMLDRHELQAKGFACFHLGANWSPKRWPAAYFARLADSLYEKWQLPIVLTGGEADQMIGDEMLQGVKKARVISLIGQTSLQVLAAIFKQSRFVVSGDSGPMHIASGVGVPVVALFGPTDPALTGPRGWGEKIILSYVPEGFQVPWVGDEAIAGEWLKSIQPQEVFTAILEKNGFLTRPSNQDELKAEIPSFCKGIQDESVKRILFITLSNIGDAIITTAVLMSVIAQFPKAKVTAVVGPRAKGVLEKSRFIEKLVVYDKKAPLKEKFKFILELRNEKYDWVIDLRNSAIPFLVSTKKRTPLFRKFRQVHMRSRHFEVLKMAGLEAREGNPFDFFSDKDEKKMLQMLQALGGLDTQPWLVVAPLAASRLKSWRFSGYREVLMKLLASREENIFLVGGNAEKEFLEPLAQLNPSRVFNLAGRTTLSDLAWLVSKCTLLLANDSSVYHLGHELKKPIVGIYGPTDFIKSGYQDPLSRVVYEPVDCLPCELSSCKFERQSCFEDLKAEKVFNVCKELLGERNQVTVG